MGDDEDDEVVVVVIGNRVRPGSSTRWSAIDIYVCVCMFSSVLFPTGKGRAEMGIIPCVERDREEFQCCVRWCSRSRGARRSGYDEKGQ